MAVTATLLTAASDTAAAATYNTASVAPAADRLLLVAVMPSRNPSGDFAEETVTGLGLTWTQVATTGLLQDTSPRRRVTWWQAQTGGAAPTPGAITIGYGTAPNSIIWSVLEVAGHDPAAPVVQTKAGIALAATSVSATFDTAPAAGNAVLAAVGIYNQEAIAPAAGYAELADTPVGGPNGQLETAWRDTGTATASGTWATASVAAGVLAVEVKAADGGGGTGATFDAAGSTAATSGTSATTSLLAAAAGTVAASTATTAAALLLAAAGGATAGVSGTTGEATAVLSAAGSVAATSSTSGSAEVVPPGPVTLDASGTTAAVSGTSGQALATYTVGGTTAATSGTTGAAELVAGARTYDATGTTVVVSGTSGDVTAILGAGGTVEAVSGTSGAATIWVDPGLITRGHGPATASIRPAAATAGIRDVQAATTIRAVTATAAIRE